MRTARELFLLVDAKKRSRIEPYNLILEDDSRREFFRFDNGKLIDYELTRINGRQIRYTAEELEGEEEFNYAEL